MQASADLLRRGATLLREACPRCGGVQINYLGKVYCLSEDKIEEISTSKVTPTSIQSVKSSEESSSPIRKMLEEKLASITRQLEATTDIQEQAKLLDLISKYLETLQKVDKK